MKPLPELQHEFTSALTGSGHDVLASIRGDGLGAERRVQIYRNNMVAGLTAALRAVYPVIDRLVGEDFFDFTAREYIARHPSRSGDVHEFGHAFGRFLAGLEHTAGLPYLPDVAALEWAYHEAFHAADAQPFDLQALAAIAPADYALLRFHLAPSVRLVVSDYPVLRIWQVNQDGYGGEPVVELDQGAENVLLVRCDLDVELYSLTPGDHALLAALGAGRRFADACAAALAAEPGIALDRSLPRYAELKVLCGFDLAPRDEPGPPAPTA